MSLVNTRLASITPTIYKHSGRSTVGSMVISHRCSGFISRSLASSAGAQLFVRLVGGQSQSVANPGRL